MKRRINHRDSTLGTPERDRLRGVEWEVRKSAFHWTCEDVHEFDDQRFPRGELHRWITDNKLQSQYKFTANVEAAFSHKISLLPTERNSLLVVIGALCHALGIVPNSSKSAGAIVRLVDAVGANLSDDTACNLLRKVPDALGARSKK